MDNRVRAKFTCFAVEESNDQTVVRLCPVYTGSPENEQFFAATPAGTITMTIRNEVAAARFEQGNEYYVDFTPAN